MNKQVAFVKKDGELIKKILLYQQQNNLPTFIDAVRQLCNSALEHNVNVQIKLK